MRRVIHAILALAFISETSAVATPADPLERRVEAITDRFVSAVRRCGVAPTFVPTIRIASAPGVISYDAADRALVIGRWETLPAPIQGFFGQWAAKDFPGEPPAVLFDRLFNTFLVGHELGHWVVDQAHGPSGLDHYEAEILANRFAITFWDLRDARETAQLVGRFSFLSTLPNPVPAGSDARRWFNTNYDNLSRTNPIAYNWYQGQFMREAWRMHGAANFCGLVRNATQRR